MRETIFDYSVNEIYEYLLKLYHKKDTEVDSILASFAFIFFIANPISEKAITEENIEKLLKTLEPLKYIREQYNNDSLL